MKKNLILAVCFCMLFGTVAMAAEMDPVEYIFSFVEQANANNPTATKPREDYAGLVQFVFREYANDATKTVLWFETINPNDSEKFTGNDLVKFWDADYTLGGSLEYIFGFNSISSTAWTGNCNSQGNNCTTPMYAVLSFDKDITFETFGEMLNGEYILGFDEDDEAIYYDFKGYLAVHTSGMKLESVQNAVFGYSGGKDPICEPGWTEGPFGPSYKDCGEEVPEPGTILLLGTGIVGLGIIARRRMTKTTKK